MGTELGAERIQQLKQYARTMAVRAVKKAGGARYAIYVVYGPAVDDHRRVFPQVPIYVGQTTEIKERIRRHFDFAIRQPLNACAIHKRMLEIMAVGETPQIKVFLTASTRLSALEKELQLAQKLLRDGHMLVNETESHSRVLNNDQLRSAVVELRWSLSVAKAAEAGLIVKGICPHGCVGTTIDPTKLLRDVNARLTMATLRNEQLPCVACSTPLEFSIAR